MRSLGVVMGLIMLGEHRQLVQVVPNDVKKMSNEWTPRGLALISAASLIVLFLLGNLRKYKPRTRIRITLWCAYLLQYAVAPAALVAITRTALDVCDTSQHHKPNTSEIQSFWAPFLLLHLGGPDTITAYSLEDNELWLRHLVEVVSQSAVALYILLLSWPGCSHLPQLSILVYLAGFIKCFERVQALRLANTEHLRDSMLGPADPGPNYHKFLEELHLKKSQGFNVKVEEVPEPPLPANDHAYPDGQGGVILVAYDLLQTFKPLLVDLILTFEQREKSQSYLRNLPSVDAFSFVDIELGFAYDMIYTKASVAYTVMGLIRRATSVLAILLVLVGFCFLNNMDNYGVVDIAITYLLIVVAMSMEIFAFIAMLRSDWTDRWLSQHNHTRSILIFPFLKQPTKLRWSNQIGQMDLLSVALQEKPATFLKIQKLFGVDKYREKHRYKTYSEVSNNLKDLIYTQFHEFMGSSSDPKALCTHKGSFSLRKNECSSLLWSITDVKFDQSILIWHIATALCYHEDQNKTDIHPMESMHISNYLLYLLVSYPVMLPMGIGMIRYRDTCAEAMRFFKDKGPIAGKPEACRKLLEVDSLEVLPSKVKGDRCKSALFDGCRLALTLRKKERKAMWKVINEVWIEILAYAATHCRGFEHRHQLRKGGEFLTHVWLLMAHLGITEQFQVSQGHARARLDVS